ncbi:MAG: phosphatase PAP2 family protein [Bacteroidales bacterium]
MFKRIKSFDAVIILFCLLTGIYMLIGYQQLDYFYIHISIRIVFLFIVYIMIKTENSTNKILLFFRHFYPILFLSFFYSETGYYNHLLFEPFDPILVRLENWIFGTQLSLTFPHSIPDRWFSELMHFGYFSYYLMIIGIPLLVYFKVRQKFDKTMFIILFSFCMYYLIFILFPSFGPQFYFPVEKRLVPEGFLFQKIMNFIIATGETQTGAFPSSHAGLALILIIITKKYFKKLLWILIPVTILLLLSTVYIKAHYAIDTIAGIFSGGLFYIISNALYQGFIVSKGSSLN